MSDGEMHPPHLGFALGLHRELPATGNFTWSPYSVASALGVAAAGARAATYDELAAALAPGGELSDLGGMLARSARPAGVEAAVANSLWMREGLSFSGDYQQSVLGWPGGALHTADFAGDAEGSRRKINADVEKTTRGLIRDLLAPGVIHRDVAAVIVNALYLKVAWRLPFGTEATRPTPFHTPSGTREVETMRQAERMTYAAVGGWRMATLGTAGDAVVDVLLPDDALATAERALTPELLTALQAAGAPTKVDLALPRFRIEAEVTLNTPLQTLGVVRGFTKRADFSGITDAERIHIDHVVHKAVLRVDEEGFEGAAATAVVMRMVAFDPSPGVPFHLDRPFLVIVRNAKTGAIYFLARIVDP